MNCTWPLAPTSTDLLACGQEDDCLGLDVAAHKAPHHVHLVPQLDLTEEGGVRGQTACPKDVV